jgi:phytoene dehydrogenase-like protein
VRGVWPAAMLARVALRGPRARALLAGLSSHSMLRLTAPLSAAFGLILAAVAQTYGWPVVRGGSQKLSDAMVKHLGALGAEVEVGRRVGSMSDIPAARCVLFDLTPRQVVAVAGSYLPARYRRALERFRYGPGVFKIDWALRAAIPWATPECMRAGTLHLGGTFEEISHAEAEVWEGHLPDRPFVILVQPSGFDPGRAPSGSHTAWAYCHVPAGCPVDMTARIEAQVERFAPGFREVVLARHTMTPAQMESDNANYVGGDINGGVQDVRQLFGRPAVRIDPYSTPNPRLFLCSSSTPPGGGVHGMSGYLAARSALRRLRPSAPELLAPH